MELINYQIGDLVEWHYTKYYDSLGLVVDNNDEAISIYWFKLFNKDAIGVNTEVSKAAYCAISYRHSAFTNEDIVLLQRCPK